MDIEVFAIGPSDPRIDEFSLNLARPDRREMRATMPRSVSFADEIRAGIASSELVWGVSDGPGGPLLAVFGVGEEFPPTGRGTPWMVRHKSTLDSYAFNRELIRRSREYLARMTSLYPVLSNSTGAWAKRSHRWLTWLGFELDDPEQLGMQGEWMHRFEMRT